MEDIRQYQGIGYLYLEAILIARIFMRGSTACMRWRRKRGPHAWGMKWISQRPKTYKVLHHRAGDVIAKISISKSKVFLSNWLRMLVRYQTPTTNVGRLVSAPFDFSAGGGCNISAPKDLSLPQSKLMSNAQRLYLQHRIMVKLSRDIDNLRRSVGHLSLLRRL